MVSDKVVERVSLAEKNVPLETDELNVVFMVSDNESERDAAVDTTDDNVVFNTSEKVM